MKKMLTMALALSAVAFATPAMADTITVNSTPTDTFKYGTGNAYVPANSLVNTNSANELALRFHVPGQTAPASDATGTYFFPAGTPALSFDWSVDGNSDNSLITLLDIGTGVSVSYDPFCPLGASSGCINDNYNGAAIGDPDLSQNSEQLNFAFLLGSDFGKLANDTYSVTLASGGHSLTAYAQTGTGAVPEPATWAMMLLGFGGIGMAMRRKRVPTLAQLA